VIGVDLGGTKLLGGVVDSALGVHQRLQRDVPLGGDRALGGREEGERIIGCLIELIEELRSASTAPVGAVGIGVPCLLDRAREVAQMAVNLPLHDLPLRARCAEQLGLPTYLDNDANLALLAESRIGAARGASDALMLTIGTGIGGAILCGGSLYRGASGSAGELGHMVIDEDGPPCQGNCPNHGCLESLASGTALGREALRLARSTPDCGLGRALASGRQITGALVTELAHDGDQAARDVVARIGTRLGVGLASLVNIFNPEVVVIGGGVIAAGEYLLAPARAVLVDRALAPAAKQARVLRAELGTDSGMVGAALLALDESGMPAGAERP
jgi:glucokinase